VATSQNKKFGDGLYEGDEKALLVAKINGVRSYPHTAQTLSVLFHDATYRYFGGGAFVSPSEDSSNPNGDVNYALICPKYDLASFHNERVLGIRKNHDQNLPRVTDLKYFEVDLSYLQVSRTFTTAIPNAHWGRDNKNSLRLVNRFGFAKLNKLPELVGVNYRRPLLRHLEKSKSHANLRQFFVDADKPAINGDAILYLNTELDSRLYARVTPIDPITREYLGDASPIRLFKILKTYNGSRFS
jgi:hypothetical protein